MKRNIGKSKNIIYCLFFMGILVTLMIPSTAFAKPPPNPHEQSVPVQLRLIREYLVDMEERLGTKMDDMEGRLNDKLGNIQSSVNIGNSKLDVLQESADRIEGIANDIYDEVTAVNIDLTTTLCFDLNVAHEESIGGHGEFGVGWPNVLDAKAVFTAAGSYGFGVGMGNQICIQVPLYSVETFPPLFTDTQEFNALVAAFAAPAQNVVPLVADIYTKLMPTPQEGIWAIANVIEAASGEDISSGQNDEWVVGARPDLLARPDVLLDPIVPDFIVQLVNNAPTLINTAIVSPCTLIDQTPFGPILNTNSGGTYEWLCGAHADALVTIVGVVNDILSVVNALNPF